MKAIKWFEERCRCFRSLETLYPKFAKVCQEAQRKPSDFCQREKRATTQERKLVFRFCCLQHSLKLAYVRPPLWNERILSSKRAIYKTYIKDSLFQVWDHKLISHNCEQLISEEKNFNVFHSTGCFWTSYISIHCHGKWLIPFYRCKTEAGRYLPHNCWKNWSQLTAWVEQKKI